MDQISTSQSTVSLGAKIATYVMAAINVLISGYILLGRMPNSRGGYLMPTLFALWFGGVLIFSFYSFFKPSWTKFFILIGITILECGALIYGLSQAIM